MLCIYSNSDDVYCDIHSQDYVDILIITLRITNYQKLYNYAILLNSK